MKIAVFSVKPSSLVTNTSPEQQWVDMEIVSDFNGHLAAQVFFDGNLATEADIAIHSGRTCTHILANVPEKDVSAQVTLLFEGQAVGEWAGDWKRPREWTIYMMDSSHTDIGLHNSQYFQRWQSEQFLDEAMKMADANPNFRYVMEGTWFWNNYGMDRGREAAKRVINDYILPGKIGVCCGIAGNLTHTYGLEELCRSARNRRELLEQWGVDSHTMSMIDNNGITWSLVAPYAEAGVRNIIFAPNQWNPLQSTVWTPDITAPYYFWNTDAGGGNSRIDVRYESALPMVFFWEGPDRESRLLVWASTSYAHGAEAFGLRSVRNYNLDIAREMEILTARTLRLLEGKYPYDIWFCANYYDDKHPNLNTVETIEKWAEKWKWPKFRMVGNPDEPFERLRAKFESQIPVLHGDITGGWYQIPSSAPEYLADKFEADRLLPTAEKLDIMAALANPDYAYPSDAFHRAWYALLYNDEHSYGVSGYQGRRVYETWLQHRDWIDFALHTAQKECSCAMSALASKVNSPTEALLVFNPSAFPRREILAAPDGGWFRTPEIPALGYKAIPLSEIHGELDSPKPCTNPPILENRFYRIAFAPDGSFLSVFDKELKRELLQQDSAFRGNQFVYTKDNHKSFATPSNATFEFSENAVRTQVKVHTAEQLSHASITSVITLPADEKRIDIDNRLAHVSDLVNTNRYSRFGYYAFPFAVEHAERKAHLNGCIASPGPSGQTGHGTETYLAPREWSCVENGSYGIALFQLDSQLVEFDHIHPDKTDCFMNEKGSAIYAYLFNDWLQMHTPGGSHVNLRFRFSILSYSGDFQNADVPKLAERIANPLQAMPMQPHAGTLPMEKSLLELPAGMRLLAVKRAEDGDGIILRIQETFGRQTVIPQISLAGIPGTRCAIDESELPETSICPPFGTATFRFREICISCRKEPVPLPNSTPAAIGSWYTGLITEPRACNGAEDGQLYLIWGQNMEKELSHYELYRSHICGFSPDWSTILARVEPGPYRVAIYEDKGLATHARIYYRVRPVFKDGTFGPMSNEFSGITREMPHKN